MSQSGQPLPPTIDMSSPTPAPEIETAAVVRVRAAADGAQQQCLRGEAKVFHGPALYEREQKHRQCRVKTLATMSAGSPGVVYGMG